MPASLLFDGRFASKTTSQLTLLNTTVSMLAKSVNLVLTLAYRDIYGDDHDEPVTCELITSPLAATEEVVALYAAGLCPLEIAVPACLHAIGTSRDQIAEAVDKLSQQEEKKLVGEDDERARANVEHSSAQTEKKQQGKHNEEDHKLGLEERKQAMSIAKEAAEVAIEKTRHEMKLAEKLSNKPAASSSSKK